MGDPRQRGVTRVRDPFTIQSCPSLHGRWKKKNPTMIFSSCEETEDRWTGGGPRSPRGYIPLGLQQVRSLPHLCHQTMPMTVFLLKHLPGTEASSQERGFYFEASVFLSFLCTCVLWFSTRVPFIRATGDGWTSSAFPPHSKAMLTTLNLLCHLQCTRSENKSSHCDWDFLLNQHYSKT